MRRLTYSPKAYIFIRSSNLDGKIFDVSADVVRGSVTQNIDDVSKAEFELRNRFKKWIKWPDTKQSIFTPMDLVTIWLQRLPGHPVQCFTGYLDSVPYYQGYPGNGPFTATCTLKKLAYTWFDPGLQLFQNWLISNGWIYDPTTGQATNPELNLTVGVKAGSNLKDGGFNKLLGRFMVDVGMWDPKDVLIADLPADIPKSAASLYRTIAQESNEALVELDKFFGNAMGVKGWNGTSAPASAASRSTDILAKMRKSATRYNIPLEVLAWAAYVMTRFEETYSHDTKDGDAWGFGIYALRPNQVVPGIPGVTDIRAKTVDGIKTSELLDALVSSNVLCKRLNQHQGSWVAGARNNDVDDIKTWVRKAIGRDLPDVDPVEAFNAAKRFGATSLVEVPFQDNMPIIDPNSLHWNSPALLALLTAQEEQINRNFYLNKAKPWLAARLYQAKYFDSGLRLATFAGKANDQLALACSDPQVLRDYAAAVKGFDGVDVQIIDPDTPTRATPFVGIGQNSLKQGIIVTETDKPTTVQLPQLFKKPERQRVGNAAGGVSWEQMAAFSATSAFAANFAFPTDIILSNLLTGEKALMNDMSCLDAVKQFAHASMRSFRSLPDGRFLAFYPDYFGAYREPYWDVENIEIVNFGITLNDEQLATHVYVVGDTIFPDGQIDIMEQIGTTGVASITQAGMLHSFIEPWDPQSTKKGLGGKLSDVYAFLQHYGARPYKEEQPIIRSTVFEFLLAWQRFMQKWSQQFATTIELTFQPEIMAGGLIRFPDHGVQVYVESVTHNFDYSSGFNTQAVIAAPSIPKGSQKSAHHPGFALAGSVNTIGE